MPCTVSGPVLKTSAGETINKLCRLFQINSREVFPGSLLRAPKKLGGILHGTENARARLHLEWGLFSGYWVEIWGSCGFGLGVVSFLFFK